MLDAFVGRRTVIAGLALLGGGVLSACSHAGPSRPQAAAIPPSPVPALGPFDAEPAWTQPGGSGTIETLAWKPGQPQFASGSSDGHVTVWSIAGRQQQTIVVTGFVSGLAWSPDGARLAIATTQGSVRLWPTAGPWPAQTPVALHRYAAVAWRPTGETLAVAPGMGSVQLLRTAGAPVPSLAIPGQTTALCWSPDGTLLAGGNRTGGVYLWSGDGRQRWTAQSPARQDVNALAWSPDGQTLAAGYEDGTVHLFAAADGAEQRTLPVGRPVNAVAWSPNGLIVAVTSLRLSVTLWAGATGAPLAELPVGYDVNDVVWSPAGDLLVVGADDHALHAWAINPPQGPGPQDFGAAGYMAR